MRKTLPFVLLFVFIFLFISSSYASGVVQENDLVTRVFANDQFSLQEIRELDHDEIQGFIHSFDSSICKNDDRRVRLGGYRFLYLLSHEHAQFLPDVIDMLVLCGLSDKNPGNRESVCDFLEFLPSDKFSFSARNRVASHAIEQSSPFQEIVRLSARLGLTDLMSHYQHLLRNGSFDAATRWTLRLALGRLGDIESARWCIEQVRRMGMNDQVVHHLAPDLVFMHHKPAMDYLLETICSEEQNCSSPNPDSNAKINCAYRLMEVVAPAINGFPVKSDEGGNLQTDDYARALKTVREWVVENDGAYEMRGD